MSENNQPDITTLTVQLVSAFVSNNSVPSEGLADLIRTTRAALIDDLTAKPTEPEAPTYTPAVSVRKSLSSPEHILSMIDGKPYKTLKRHLASHGLSPNDYRERYGLPKSYPLVAPNYSEARRAVATKLGLGRKPVSGAKAPAPVAAAAAPKPAAPAKAAATAKPAPAKAPAAPKASDVKAPEAKAAAAKPAPAKAAETKTPAAKAAASRKRLSIATPATEKKDAAAPKPAAPAKAPAKSSDKPTAAKTPAKAAKKKPAAKAAPKAAAPKTPTPENA